MSFLELCELYFNTKCLYAVLSVSKDANSNELKKAYHKVSRKVHPDRVPEIEKEEATKKFQTLGKVYSILSDEEKRKIYNETGEIDDENFDSDCNDWMEYWRLLFKEVTIDSIKKFEKKYKNSEEELEDIKTAYQKSGGDMTVIINEVLYASVDDEERFRSIINDLIEKDEVISYKKFTKETKARKEKRKKRAEAEAKEAEDWSKKIGLDSSDDSLAKLIKKRGQEREANMDSFLDNLAAKYGANDKKKGGKKSKK